MHRGYPVVPWAFVPKTMKDLGVTWRGAVLTTLAAGALALCLAGCRANLDTTQPDADVAGANSDASAGETEVAPPAPVFAADPQIPLNEGIVGAAPVPADYGTDVAPPAPLTEERPASPESSDVWIPGYWWWSAPLNRYVWVGGAWRHPPPSQVWFPGSWRLVSGRYVWAPGYWGSHDAERQEIDFGPPRSEPKRTVRLPESSSSGFRATTRFTVPTYGCLVRGSVRRRLGFIGSSHATS